MSLKSDLHNSDEIEKEELKSFHFRASLPQVEVDSLAGFFEDQRLAIRTLKTEKSRLKAVIIKWTQKFQKKHGRLPNWSEKKAKIGKTYDDYQEARVLRKLI